MSKPRLFLEIFKRLTAMAEPNPIYAAPTELKRCLNVHSYKYFAPSELLPAEHEPRALNAKRIRAFVWDSGYAKPLATLWVW
jgi:hypothetical protein